MAAGTQCELIIVLKRRKQRLPIDDASKVNLYFEVNNSWGIQSHRFSKSRSVSFSFAFQLCKDGCTVLTSDVFSHSWVQHTCLFVIDI